MADLHFDVQKKLYEELCKKYPECPAMWKYFLALTEIPRPSHHTEKVSAWAQEVGKKLGGVVKADKLGNVSIAFPGTKGKENLPAVVLQAHLDMVGTKAADHNHNFVTDPLVPYIDGELLRATNTTLGGDDGSGVAACLALAEDKTLERGPLEILFTIDEETGLVGALGLTEGELLSKNAKYLINVDSEDFGEITLSCAGGVDRILSFPMSRTAQTAGFKHYSLTVKDLKGGHSGVDIQIGRANATMWLVEMLLKNDAALNGAEYRITKMHGGNAHNAIPSLASVEFSVAADKADAFIEGVKAVFERLKAEFAKIEGKPVMDLQPLEHASADQALTFSSTRTALEALSGLHHGVWKWSEAVPSLVETSQSVSVTTIKAEGPMEVEVFARSSINEALTALSNYMIAYAALYGGKQVEHSPDCPGWPAEPDSRLCKTACSIFKETFGYDAKLVPIHAGLECGIIINKFPENKIEAISVGPDVKNPHTTMETLGLPSCVKLYTYLRNVIAALGK